MSLCDNFRYNLVFMILTYILPITIIAFSYWHIGKTLWGSEAVGEKTRHLEESIKCKKKVNIYIYTRGY